MKDKWIVIRGVLFEVSSCGSGDWALHGVTMPTVRFMRCLGNELSGGHLKIGRLVFSIVWIRRQGA